jgi:uncharacterized protein (TIGR00299 family) protein
MKILIIDPKIAGISGDMLLAALVDLTGASDGPALVGDALNKLEYCERFSCSVRDVDAGGISATQLLITLEERRPGNHRDLGEAACHVADDIGLSGAARGKALAVLDDLLAVDEKLHRTAFHHHETASIDTLFDLLGSLLILDRYGFLEGEIYATPPALGSGFIRIGNGEIACPAPATLEILSRHAIPYSSFPAEMEMTTPTGAALLANLADRILDPYPPMTPVRVGYGTGTRRIPGRPSVLRVVEGTNLHAIQDRIIMLETNLDDVRGEIVGYTVERLREAGAVDVFVTSASGKKNRPVQILHVITNQLDYPHLLGILMEETGTLGVRILDIPRLVADRSRGLVRVTVAGCAFDVSVKTSSVNGKVISRKPEYEDLRRIAKTLAIPMREVNDEIRKQLPVEHDE